MFFSHPFKNKAQIAHSATDNAADNEADTSVKERHYWSITANKSVIHKTITATLFSLLSLNTPSYATTAEPAAKHQSQVAAYADVSQVPKSIRAKTDIAISNYPLFLLSEAVTKGAPSGHLLLGPGDVGHHGSLSPSDMKTVKDSRYVVWFGEQLESNLAKPLANSNNTISLFGLNAFDRQTLRDVKGQPIDNTLDPHIWLDPDNAKAITRALGAIYSRANPEYKAVYAANVRDFANKMDAAVAGVGEGASVTHTGPRPYWAYHDAFQYLEPSLNLSMAGALTVDHHLPPKASQFHWLKQNRPQPTMCILLQSDSNQGVLSKLGAISSTVQQEDMSDAKDFISGWRALAQDVQNCINQAIK